MSRGRPPFPGRFQFAPPGVWYTEWWPASSALRGATLEHACEGRPSGALRMQLETTSDKEPAAQCGPAIELVPPVTGTVELGSIPGAWIRARIEAVGRFDGRLKFRLKPGGAAPA